MHHSQRGKRRVKVILLFWYKPLNPKGRYLEDARQEAGDWPCLASVRVPRGLPIFKLRKLILHVEIELRKIYGFQSGKRANMILIADDGSDSYEFTHDLPVTDVVFV
jgi:hypothetical protein